MASLALGGLLASKELFSYNRKNFFFDQKIRQERQFQEQDMRVEQFALYREDVRDLVELTVGKMDLYLVAAALLVDRTIVMICKQNEAFPPWSPDWAVTLNAITLASGVFYLLLALWLAMYASISAQSFGARLLTQFVRLPYATREELEQATASGQQYEAANPSQMLRVPVLYRPSQQAPDGGASGAGGGSGPGAGGAAGGSGGSSATQAVRSADQEGAAGVQMGEGSGAGEAGAAGAAPAADSGGVANPSPPAWDLLPAAMLDHIRLYRRVQLNWQAYDAYARVCLFVGASSLLYSCLYWSLGSFLQGAHAPVPAIGVAVIFSTVQIMLSKLDLRLTRRATVFIGSLLATTPLMTTIGILLYQDMINDSGEPAAWKRNLMMFCAVWSHALHAIVVGLILLASWPDPSCDDDALLPGKFRSTLYLDVFGWLLNPNGPGMQDPAASQEEEEQEGCAIEPPLHASDGGGGTEAAAAPACASEAPAADAQLASSTRRSIGGRNQEPRPPPSAGGAQRFRVGSEPSPGTNSQGARTQEQLPVRAASFSHGAADDLRRRMQMRRIDLSPELRREANRVFNASPGHSFTGSPPSSSPRRRGHSSPEQRWGGQEAAPLETIEQVTVPTAAGPTNFTPMPAQRVSRKTKPPGATPWLAFKHGTLVIFFVWVASTALTSCLFIADGWKEARKSVPEPEPEDPKFAATVQGLPDQGLLDAACDAVDAGARRAQLAPGWVGAPWAAAKLSMLQGADGRRDLPRAAAAAASAACAGPCGLARPRLAAAALCERGGLNATGRPRGHQCVVALLHHGGREVSLCRTSLRSSGLTLSLWKSLRLAPGAGRLRGLAVAKPAAADAAAPLSAASFKGLRLIGRLAGGRLLMLRPLAKAETRSPGRRWLLVPELELEPDGPTSRPSGSEVARPLAPAPAEPLEEEVLLSSGDAVLSLQVRGFGAPADGSCAAPGFAASCDALFHPFELRLRAWDLGTGLHTEQTVLLAADDDPPAWREPPRDASALLASLCAAAAAAAPRAAARRPPAAASADFLGLPGGVGEKTRAVA